MSGNGLISQQPSGLDLLREAYERFKLVANASTPQEALALASKYAGFGIAACYQPQLAAVIVGEFIRDLTNAIANEKIKPEKLNTYSAQQGLLEVLNIIEKDNLEPEKLEAMKRLFFLSLQDDQDAPLVKYFISICSRIPLESLLVLRAAYELEDSPDFLQSVNGGLNRWRRLVAEKLGHGLIDYVVSAETFLEQERLIGEASDGSSYRYSDSEVRRLTKTGYKFCRFIIEQ